MFRINASNSPLFVAMLFVFILIASAQNIQAQCYGYQRYYVSIAEANSNVGGLGGNTDVTNEANSLGSNLKNYSEIDVSTLTSVTRYSRLKFAKTFTGGEPIHVKLDRDLLVAILGITIELQAYDNGSPVGTKVTLSGASLGAVAGKNIVDIIIPNPSSSYNAVQITASAGLGVNNIVRVYAAYVDELVTTGVNCNTTADVIYGVTSGVLGGVNNVVLPNNVADNDLTSYATLTQTLGVAGYVHATTLLTAPTVSGDSISVVLKVPGSALLDVSLFTNLSVVMYLGNTQVGSIPANDSNIKIRLLDDDNDIYRFTYPATYSFDRISVQAGGVATALAEVWVYDIRRIIPTPIATIDGNVAASITLCEGASTILAIKDPQSCTVYNWYDAAVGGNLVFTGTSYPRNSLSVSTYNYWIEASRAGCAASTSGRIQETIVVNAKPAAPALVISSN
jgi:hypothetical protein